MRVRIRALAVLSVVACVGCRGELVTEPTSRAAGVSASLSAAGVVTMSELDVDDIEPVEVLKGAAAASAYGGGCTATIVVHTRRGRGDGASRTRTTR